MLASLRGVSVALAILLYASTGRAEDRHAMRGGMYAGSYYAFGLGDEASFDSSQYVVAGGFVDHRWFHASVETPGPFLILDGLAAVVGFLAGQDIGVPLYSALNGEHDAGRFRMIEFEGAARPLTAGPHALELGVHGDFSLVQAYFEGLRLGSSVFDLAPTVGYAYATHDVVFRVNAMVGNGFGSERTGNPFVGGSAFASVRVYDVFGLTARFDVVGEQLDLGTTGLYLPPAQAERVIEWGAFGATTFGLTYLID